MHYGLAESTEGLQVAGLQRQRHVLDERQGRRARLTAAKAIELSRTTGLLSFGVPVLEELAHNGTVEQNRLRTINRLEPSVPPVEHRVLVNATTNSELRRVVGPVQLDDIWIDPTLGHLSTP
jgi:hypothetical protein